MSHFNSISSRTEYGPPPGHFKQIGKPNSQGKFAMAAPNLEMLTKGNRDYNLVFNGNPQFRVPLKWKNTFIG